MMGKEHRYLVEVETREHRFVMTTVRAESGENAKALGRRVGGLQLALAATIVACSKDAPEFGDTCRRELIE